MSVTELMVDLRDHGIQLESRGDRLRYSPKEKMTTELAERVKIHKTALLAILTADDIRAAVLWHSALDLLEDDSEFSPETLAACRRAEASWDRSPGESAGLTTNDETTP